MKNILYAIWIVLLLGSCNNEEEYLPTNFNHPIPQVNITENVNVGLFYYNYTPADWTKKYTGTPTLGEYSALTPSVMDQHRTWADLGGIDYFIFKWNGAADDSLLNNFKTGRTQNVRMVINYNTAHLGASASSPLEGDKLTTMTDELKTFASAHFGSDDYFKINGNPVLLITPVDASLGSVDYTAVIPAVRTELSSIGVNPFIIGEINGGWLPPQRYSTANQAFDAVVLSDWKADGNYGYDRSVFFAPFIDYAFINWSDSTTAWGIDFVPCILPGFDDRVMSPSSKIFTVERSINFYTDMCNVAKSNMGINRIVTINSWNDFQYGTTLEPTQEYGTDYLEVTRTQFKIN
jgi:hypothetical protein